MTFKAKCYEYEWYDHNHKEGWQWSINATPYVVHSVGYLVGEDKLHWHFTQGVEPLNGAMQGTMSILKASLKRKKLIFTKSIAN